MAHTVTSKWIQESIEKIVNHGISVCSVFQSNPFSPPAQSESALSLHDGSATAPWVAIAMPSYRLYRSAIAGATGRIGEAEP